MSESIEPIVSFDMPPDHPRAKEWAAYRRELPRLLAEGLEGRFALVQGDVVDSTWPTFSEAVEAGYERFDLTPFMVHQIWKVEPVYRVPSY
jgi:hypothetical protein